MKIGRATRFRRRLSVPVASIVLAAIAFGNGGTWSPYGAPCSQVITTCPGDAGPHLTTPTLSVSGALDSVSPTTLTATGHSFFSINVWYFWVVGTAGLSEHPILIPYSGGCPVLVSGQVSVVGGWISPTIPCEFVQTIPPLGPGLTGAFSANVQVIYFWSPSGGGGPFYGCATNGVQVTFVP
jgi:hypothetical protein